MRFASFLLLLLIPAVTFGQSRGYPPNLEGARVEIYKTTPQTELKLWVFDPPNHKPEEMRPAIVFFFGGGWRGGTPGQFENQCRDLASLGMVAITVDYRVLSRHKTFAASCVADAKSAIRWIRTNAGRLGIDPNRIVAAGGSAGGHLAACTAVIQGMDELTDDLTVNCVPNLMALFNPAMVLAPLEGLPSNEAAAANLAKRLGVPAKEISPIHQLRKNLPPTIIFHGKDDPTVPFATVEKYTQAATELGNQCELVGYPNAKHGFFNHGRDGVPGKYYTATMSRLRKFLEQHHYIHTGQVAAETSGNVHFRNHFDNSWKAFAGKKKGTVAFIGGSITEMNGYRVMVEQDLRRRFPGTQFKFINAGISSTCSTTGAHRLARDVLAMQPDLLFVEFAVNDDQDASHAERECRRGMEGILRTAREKNPSMDVIVTHFVNPPMLELLQQGKTPVSSGAHESVAAHYGVSTIDLAREVAERIEAKQLTWKQYGGTHPAPAGNRVAADMIEELLDAAWADHQALSDSNPGRHLVPEPLDTGSYVQGQLVPVAKSKFDKSWVLGIPAWDSIPGGKRGRFTQLEMLCTEADAAELTFDFEGQAVGLYVLAGPDAGRVEYSLDGADFETRELFHRFSKGLHYPRTVMLATDLEPGPHQLKLRVAKTSHPQSKGNAVRILEFVTN